MTHARAEQAEAERDRLKAERDTMRDWMSAANRFAWAHETFCARVDGSAPCNCGLDQFLSRPRPVVESVAAIRQRAEQAEAERDRLKAEQQTCLDHGPHLGCHWCPECYQRAWTAGKADAESASQSLVERVRGLEEALKQARDFYWGRARYDHAEDHAIDFDGPKEDCPDCQRQCAVIAKWDALLSSVSEQKEEQ